MNKFYSLLETGVSTLALCCFAGAAAAADVTSEGELANALQTGTDATLASDIEISGNLPATTGGSFTIDGNGHTLSGVLTTVSEDEEPLPSVSGFNFGAGTTVDITNLTATTLKQAINNSGTIGKIENSVFENNMASGVGADVSGGAINNSGTIGEISGSVFRDNMVTAEGGDAYGGAIANTGGQTLNLINTSFYNNYAEVTGDTAYDTEETPAANVAVGGAIYSNGDVNITARGQDVVFSGNMIVKPEPPAEEEGGEEGGEGGEETGGEGEEEETEPITTSESNAIAMDGGNLNLITEGGNIRFDDAIASAGNEYNMTISGDGEVIFNNSVFGVKDFVLDGATLTLGATYSSLSVGSYTANGSPILNVTVDPDEKVASMITVGGDVVGTTRVVVNVTSETKIPTSDSILFVSAAADDKETAGDFVVYRVFGSPYMWTSTYYEASSSGEGGSEGGEDLGGGGDLGGGEDAGSDDGSDSSAGSDDGSDSSAGGDTSDGNASGSTGEGSSGITSSGWYLSMTNESNPDFRPMAPEIASFLALHSAAVEQNRDVVGNVRRSVANNKFLLKRYDLMYEDDYKSRAVANLWANPVYRYVQVNAPQEWEASIAGFDAGLDLQSDASNKFGVFGSYRYGTYDVSKHGYFTANLDSQIEISSALFGVYYRYDYNRFWSFATAYAGNQHAEIETDDGIKVDADGMQYGVGYEMGYAFVSGYDWTLEPSLGIFYTGIDYDDMEDEYGKTAEYSMLHQIEGEIGIKLEKTYHYTYGYSKLYIKPSIIQTINFGNEVKITHLGEVDSLDDQTLGRIELGGRYAVDDKMNLYGYVNYTMGSDYDDMTAGLGFMYRWY